MKYKETEPRSSRFSFIEEIPLKVMSNGRVRRSSDEWRDLVSRCAASGVGLREFCRKEKVNLTSLQRWQKRLAQSKQPTEFIDVTPAVQDSVSPWAVELEFSSGTILRLRG